MRRLGQGLWWLSGIWLLLVVSVQAAEFHVRDARLHQGTAEYLLDARIDFDFSEVALEALRNGVPLTVNVELSLEEERSFLWNRVLFQHTFRLQLRYHALAQLYQVEWLNGDRLRNFSTLSAAIQSLGFLRGLPVARRDELRLPDQFVARIRASLDIEALPLPLRPLAYINPAWHLDSDWFSWRPKF